MSLAVPSMAFALVLGVQDQTAGLPLVITRMSIDACAPDLVKDGTGNPRIEVKNTGTRTILAWGVKFQYKYSDGRLEPSSHSVDAASVPPEQRTSSIAPGAATANLNAGNPCGGRVVPADTVITDGTPTFVIFDDDTALGDERLIALMFDRRRSNQMFWQKMQTIVEQAAWQTNDAASALATIRERMEAEPDPKFRTVGDYQWFLNLMSPRLLALTTPQATLDRFRSIIPAQKANADAHAVRR